MGIALLFGIPVPELVAQKANLFADDSLLRLSLKISINEIRGTKTDSVYHPHLLYYQASAGPMDSIRVLLKSRGNFRYRECKFPPLRMKISKKDAKKTLFEDNRDLKLVLPCKNQNGNDEVIREYICYKLYELVSPFYFQTRLAQLDFTDLSRKKPAQYSLQIILIENFNQVAKRTHAKAMSELKLFPQLLNDTNAARFYLFQYLISNTDWSTAYQHNSRLLLREPHDYIAVPYDFDMSGLVDAPYAEVSQVSGEKLDVSSVRERLYRGFCLKPEVLSFVRREFLQNELAFMAVPEKYVTLLGSKDVKRIQRYMQEFFDTLKSDRMYKREIENACRANP